MSDPEAFERSRSASGRPLVRALSVLFVVASFGLATFSAIRWHEPLQDFLGVSPLADQYVAAGGAVGEVNATTNDERPPQAVYDDAEQPSDVLQDESPPNEATRLLEEFVAVVDSHSTTTFDSMPTYPSIVPHQLEIASIGAVFSSGTELELLVALMHAEHKLGSARTVDALRLARDIALDEEIHADDLRVIEHAFNQATLNVERVNAVLGRLAQLAVEASEMAYIDRSSATLEQPAAETSQPSAPSSTGLWNVVEEGLGAIYEVRRTPGSDGDRSQIRGGAESRVRIQLTLERARNALIDWEIQHYRWAISEAQELVMSYDDESGVARGMAAELASLLEAEFEEPADTIRVALDRLRVRHDLSVPEEQADSP